MERPKLNNEEIEAQFLGHETVTPKVVLKEGAFTEIHTVFRTYSKTGMTTDGGAQGGDEIDAYLGSWLQNGWTLIDTHFAGAAIEGWQMCYVFAR